MLNLLLKWCRLNMSRIIYLSHLLDSQTPSYGNRNSISLEKKRSIDCGDHANDSFLHMSVHQGTHIDMPIHFYRNGQSIEDYPATFWIFNYPLIIEVKPIGQILYQEIIDALNGLAESERKICDLLMVKTEIGSARHLEKFWSENPGFSPDLYAYFRSELPSLKVFGFDSISLTGFQYRDIGRLAHQQFLNPKAPILLLEDMKLNEISSETKLNKVVIAPLRLTKCDGLPCTIMGWL